MKKIAIISRSYYDFLNHIKENVKDVTIQNYDDKYVNVNCFEDLEGHSFDKAIMLNSAKRVNDLDEIIEKFQSLNVEIKEYIN